MNIHFIVPRYLLNAVNVDDKSNSPYLIVWSHFCLFLLFDYFVLTTACPDICTDVVDPVCATNGRTYISLCALSVEACKNQKNPFTVAYRGRCAGGKNWHIQYISLIFNPILTGLFESKFLLGGGPEGADQIWRPQDSCQSLLFFLRKTVYLLCYYDLCKLDA